MADPSTTIIPVPPENEIVEVETSPLNVAIPDLGHYPEDERKIFFGPGTKSGIYLRLAQVVLMVTGLVTILFIHSFFEFTNNRVFISGIALNTVWSFLSLVHDFNAMANTIENAFSTVTILLVGNLIVDWFLLFSISLGAANFFFLLYDQGFYYQFRRRPAHMTAVAMTISSLGWLCTSVSTMTFLSIVLRNKNR